VPTQDLPLEGVVRFQQPPAALARAMLAYVCHTEGVPMRSGAGREQHARGTGDGRARVDLRQLLHQGQFGRPGAADDGSGEERAHADHAWPRAGGGREQTEGARSGEAEVEAAAALREMGRAAVSGCIADRQLAGGWTALYGLADAHADDEVGVATVCADARRTSAVVATGYYGRAAEVSAEVVLAGAREILDSRRPGCGSEEYMGRLEEELGERVPGERFALDRRTMVMDYGPLVREMERARGRAGGGGGGGGGLRRSGRLTGRGVRAGEEGGGRGGDGPGDRLGDVRELI
jgi:hypothetical protein